MEISRPSLEERAAECARELTFSATVAYDGAPFAGFAKQPGQLTVQGELERALSLLFRRPVDVVCAGRTDAGVHARGQVVSFDIDACELRDRTPYNLRRSLNALTCEGIVVRAVEERPALMGAGKLERREMPLSMKRSRFRTLVMKRSRFRS